MDHPNAGYIIQNIITVGLHFERTHQIDFTKTIHNKADIKQEIGDKGIGTSEPFNIILECTLIGSHDDSLELYKITSKIAGVFQKIGEPDLSFEAFTTINGPAIIYPFIRESISDISRRAGLPNVMLPPINFTKKL